MKKLLLLAFLICGTAVAQEPCYLVCHNGKVVKSVTFQSLQGHLNGHNDVYLGQCNDYPGEIGDDCQTLSLPKLDLKKQIPSGLDYYITDLWGRIYRVGKTDGNFKSSLPKGGVFFIRVEGYETLKRLF